MDGIGHHAALPLHHKLVPPHYSMFYTINFAQQHLMQKPKTAITPPDGYSQKLVLSDREGNQYQAQSKSVESIVDRLKRALLQALRLKFSLF